jgi:hypothetical protein
MEMNDWEKERMKVEQLEEKLNQLKSEYLIFAGHNYYPYGGWHDFKGKFNSKDECLEYLVNNNKFDWWHIVQDGKIIKSG